MKRDLGLLRRILLVIEAADDGRGRDFKIEFDDVEPEIVYGHLKLLLEALFIDGIESQAIGHELIYPTRLTWEGHDFLDAIRDDNIWQKTQAALVKVSGGASVEVVKAFAVYAAKEILGIQ
ncbi:MAG: DUF2513 domain-containing protein [Pseudomonadota bacterium]